MHYAVVICHEELTGAQDVRNAPQGCQAHQAFDLEFQSVGYGAPQRHILLRADQSENRRSP